MTNPKRAFNETYVVLHPDCREYIYRCKFCGHDTTVPMAGGPLKVCCDTLKAKVQTSSRGVVNDFFEIVKP